jgi:WXG100 family type VII secretion target
MIRVNFMALTQAAADIDEVVRAMDISLSDLNRSLDTKLADWDGGAFGSYADTKAMWMNAADQIKILLNAIKSGVDKSNETMAMTELNNAHRLTRGV